MLVCMRMVHPAITVNARASIRTAIDLIGAEAIRTLPVVDRQGRLLGITTDEDLEQFVERHSENSAIVDDSVVEEVMERDVLTVTENTPIEEAARIIVDYGISSLPVVRGGFVVGMIDDSAILRMVMEMASSRSDGVRVTYTVDNDPNVIKNLLLTVMDLNGSVRSLSTFTPDQKDYQLVTVKVDGVEKYALKQALASHVREIIDIR